MAHRDVAEIVAFDSLPGRIMKLDLATGAHQDSVAISGHSIRPTVLGTIDVGTLTGNTFRWSRTRHMGERRDEARRRTHARHAC